MILFTEKENLIAQKLFEKVGFIREGLPTWGSPEKYDEMKLSLWVYNDTTERKNMIACKCHHEGQKAAADPNERKDVPPLF